MSFKLNLIPRRYFNLAPIVAICFVKKIRYRCEFLEVKLNFSSKLHISMLYFVYFFFGRNLRTFFKKRVDILVKEPARIWE